MATPAPAEIAYRSADPAVIAIYRAHNVERVDQIDALNKQLKAWGFPSPHPVMIRGGGAFGNADQITGVAAVEGSEPFPGWRVSREHGAWVPRMTTKAGKRIAEELEQVQPPKGLRERLPGMPLFQMFGNRIITYGLFVLGDTMYVHWDHQPRDEVDTSIWTEIKMSDYWVAKEELNGRAKQDQDRANGDLPQQDGSL